MDCPLTLNSVITAQAAQRDSKSRHAANEQWNQGCLEEDSVMTLPIHQFLWLLSNGRSHCSCFRRPFTCLDIVIIFDLFKIVRSSCFGLCDRRQVRRWNLRTFSKFYCFLLPWRNSHKVARSSLTKTKVESMSRCCDHSIGPFTVS